MSINLDRHDSSWGVNPTLRKTKDRTVKFIKIELYC